MIKSRICRPLKLDIDNSLIALGGSLLDVTGNLQDTSSQAAIVLSLNQLSAFTTEPLLLIRAEKAGRGLDPVQVEDAHDCLFVALTSSFPMVSFEGLEASEQKVKELFSWNGGHNAYWGYEYLLEQSKTSDGMVPLRLDLDSWPKFTGEFDARFPRSKFEMPPGSGTVLSQTPLQNFVLKNGLRSELMHYGANLDELKKELPNE